MWKHSISLIIMAVAATSLIMTVTAEPDDYAVPSELALPGDLPPLLISEPQPLSGDTYGLPVPQPFYGPMEPQPIIPYPYSNLPPLGFNPGWGWNNPGWGGGGFPLQQLQLQGFQGFGRNFPNNGWGWPSPFLG